MTNREFRGNTVSRLLYQMINGTKMCNMFCNMHVPVLARMHNKNGFEGKAITH